jgi:hypothetical protein
VGAFWGSTRRRHRRLLVRSGKQPSMCSAIRSKPRARRSRDDGYAGRALTAKVAARVPRVGRGAYE